MSVPGSTGAMKSMVLWHICAAVSVSLHSASFRSICCKMSRRAADRFARSQVCTIEVLMQSMHAAKTATGGRSGGSSGGYV